MRRCDSGRIHGLMCSLAMVFAMVAPPLASSNSVKTPIRIAIMGDSDSAAYQDRYSFPPGSTDRGDSYRPYTLQWTEVLTRLRSAQLDMGPWGLWGQRKPFAQLFDLLGMSSRSPKKEDSLYNFAASGAVCDDLITGPFRQAPRLAELIAQDPNGWADAITVIRMGGNDIGHHPMLQLVAKEPTAPAFLERVANCVRRTREAVDLLHEAQPTLRIVIVGPFNDTDDPYSREEWHSATEQANLRRAFSFFIDDLRKLTAGNSRLHFMDDRPWFIRRWGERDANGNPTYKTVRIEGVLDVTHTVGDEPTHSVMKDDHNGLVWNTFWAQALVEELNTAWQLGIPPITESEIAGFIKATVKH